MSRLEKSRKAFWVAVTLFLLSWNGSLAIFAGPGTLFQAYDGVQYQLLARNRLLGHHEVGDTAHTVRWEGSHPMWRPTLVWMIDGLARMVGSVQTAAIITSVLGTTLMEVLTLWLAWRCLGWGVCLTVLALFVSPLIVSVHLMLMAIGQGPEPWSAAALLVGVACLIEARARRSWKWALAAGAGAGLAEWFRTGNLVLFAGPCAVYGLAALCRRDGRQIGLSAAALAAFVLTSSASERLVPSTVDKTTANLWANLLEHQGYQQVLHDPEHGRVLYYLHGLKLVPGNAETYYDHIVREAHGLPLTTFLQQRGEELVQQYVEHLEEMAAGGARGLRFYLGTMLAICLAGQLGASLLRLHHASTDCLALAAGPLLFFVGPLVLLRGDQPVHYLSVGLPSLLIVIAAGVVAVAHAGWTRLAARCPAVGQRPLRVAVLLLAPFVCLSVSFFHGAIHVLHAGQLHCAAAQAELDALPLRGLKIACRNMSWFVDREVQTVLLPFAEVPELEQYALAQGLDGLLIWTQEGHYFFRTTPYDTTPWDSTVAFEEALDQSKVFGPVQISGDWRLYPVRRGVTKDEGQVSGGQ